MTQSELKQQGKEAAQAVSNIVNYGGTGVQGFLEEMGRDHRTLQQSFTRLCLQWLEQVATRKGPMFIDPRNEASQKVAEKLIGNPEILPSQTMFEQMFLQQLFDQFAEKVAADQGIPVEEVKKNWDIYKPSKWLPHI